MSQPKKQSKKQQKKKKSKEPKLFEESYLPNDSARPPYIYLFLIAFVIFTVIWKGFIVNSAPEQSIQEPRSNISPKEISIPIDITK